MVYRSLWYRNQFFKVELWICSSRTVSFGDFTILVEAEMTPSLQEKEHKKYCKIVFNDSFDINR